MKYGVGSRIVVYQRLIPVLLVSVLALSSCMTEFREPLGIQDILLSDDDLIGVWYTAGSNFWDEYNLLTILKMRGGFLRIIYTDDKSGILELQGYVVVLEKNYYINAWPLIHEERDNKIPDFYYICHYSLNVEGDLKIWYFNDEFLKDAIRKGKIEGRIVMRDGWECEPEIRASTDELREFLLNHNKSEYLEEDPWPWRKMKM